MVTSAKAPASSRLKSGAVKWAVGRLLLPEQTVAEHSFFVVSSMVDVILHKQTAVRIFLQARRAEIPTVRRKC